MNGFEIPFLDPMAAAARLADRVRLVFLDSAMMHESLGRWSYVACDPAGLFRVEDGVAHWQGKALGEAPMAAMRRCLRRDGATVLPNEPPFQGGAVGFFTYEAARLFERVPETRHPIRPVPQVDFAVYETLLAFDVIDHRAYAIGPDAAALVQRLDRPAPKPADIPAAVWRDSRSRDEYEREVERVIRYIRDGDIFQANLSHRFTAHPQRPPDPIAVWRALRAANPAPFGALLVDGERFVASTSPERFLRVAGREVETRPIKGTRRRSPRPAEDAMLACELAASEKDRAENIMIVDLLRNDLSRVCEPSSVTVPVICGVESFTSVHHLVSVVHGRLAEDYDVFDLVAATFPGGSITGAPKIRAMEIIAELEGQDRGVYCGAIGWIGFDGGADLNIAIRTLTFDGEAMHIAAGGGITLLSDPAAEYDETLAKAERVLGVFAGRAVSAADEAA